MTAALDPQGAFSLTLLDHFVGNVEDARGNSEACLGGLEVDDQRVFRWVLNGEVGRTGALEDVDLGCRLRVQFDRAVPGGHQAAAAGDDRPGLCSSRALSRLGF